VLQRCIHHNIVLRRNNARLRGSRTTNGKTIDGEQVQTLPWLNSGEQRAFMIATSQPLSFSVPERPECHQHIGFCGSEGYDLKGFESEHIPGLEDSPDLWRSAWKPFSAWGNA
jgi:hypothetical protein